jgi:hypothetical protein
MASVTVRGAPVFDEWDGVIANFALTALQEAFQ